MQRMTIYVPDDLHAAIVQQAEAAGQKLSTFATRALQNHVNHLSSLVRQPKPKDVVRTTPGLGSVPPRGA